MLRLISEEGNLTAKGSFLAFFKKREMVQMFGPRHHLSKLKKQKEKRKSYFSSSCPKWDKSVFGPEDMQAFESKKRNGSFYLFWGFVCWVKSTILLLKQVR